ncbi:MULTISPECIES: hypothetical protein [Salinivibrio]|uniref:Uncharacterized protein n=3 Tax=Salinivibrio TaxID=51366 RepID=A0ABY7LD94_9GAMM|nr:MULTISPECIES: hypothetical protein [Salinivibrio]QIR04899.1 hypothetical protein HBA18_08675 [Salinivibrio costicola]WBA13825.1 hypothetical protein N7E60_08760 [Salinivibrio proteolyticus]
MHRPVMQKKAKQVTQKMIDRAVASSTAIETQATTEEVEAKLKENRQKYQALALAD